MPTPRRPTAVLLAFVAFALAAWAAYRVTRLPPAPGPGPAPAAASEPAPVAAPETAAFDAAREAGAGAGPQPEPAPRGPAAEAPGPGKLRPSPPAIGQKGGPRAIIAGRVVGPDGGPVAGAAVEALLEKRRRESMTRTRTAADGTYAVEVAETGSYAVAASDGVHRRARREGVQATVGERTSGIDLRLAEPGAAIVGRVSDPQGAPIAGVGVVVLGAAQGISLQAGTDAGGRYRVGGLDAGEYRVTAFSDAHLLDLAGKSVQVPATGDVVLDIVLETGLAIEGTVVGPAGEPVAGARVSASPERVRADKARSGSGRDAKSGPDGRFSLSGLAEGTFALRASGPNGGAYTSARLEGVEAGATGVRVVLGLGGTIEGLVHDGATGAPVPSAGVDLGGEVDPGAGGAERRAAKEEATWSRTKTGEDGVFRFDGVAPGVYRITARAADRAPGEVGGVLVTAGGSARVDVILEAGAEVAGRVVALPGRVPVAGASVRDATRGSGSVSVKGDGAGGAPTDDAGRFVLRGVAAGRRRIAATAPSRPPGEAPVDVPASGGRVEVEIVLPAGGAIEGRVLDATGAPRAGAVVSAFSAEVAGKAEVDADGRYAIRGLPAGQAFVFVEGMDEAKRSGPAGFRTVSVRDGETTVLDFIEREEPRPVVVTGLVRRRGTPLPGATLGFAPVGGAILEQRSAETDRDGAYRVLLPPGRHRVVYGGYAMVGELLVPAGVAEARFDLDLPPGAIRGRVVDAGTGEPIARARVTAARASSSAAAVPGPPPGGGDGLAAELLRAAGGSDTTRADGTFEILDVPPGAYDVTATLPSHGSGRVAGVTVGDAAVEGLVLRVARGATLRGLVVDPEGRPAPGIEVDAAPGAGRLEVSSLMGAPEGRSDESGAFAIEGLPPGSYWLVTMPGKLEGGPVTATRVDFRGDGTDEPVRIVLPRTGSLLATIARPDGEPAEGATLDIRDAAGGTIFVSFAQLFGLTAAGDGTVHLADIAPGRYLVAARLGERASEPVPVEVRPGEETPVRLELP